MRSVKLPASLVSFLVLFISCGKIEKLPPEPSISFTSFEVFDSLDILGNKVKGGRLSFRFQDGDGDLGLDSPKQTGSVDSTNLFFTLYRKTGGLFREVANNDPLKPSPYRIPFMDRQGQNKILRGNITITFLYLFYYPSDTIKYKFYVKDRGQHLSNVDSSCVVVLTVNGTCNK